MTLREIFCEGIRRSVQDQIEAKCEANGYAQRHFDASTPPLTS